MLLTKLYFQNGIVCILGWNSIRKLDIVDTSHMIMSFFFFLQEYFFFYTALNKIIQTINDSI